MIESFGEVEEFEEKFLVIVSLVVEIGDYLWVINFDIGEEGCFVGSCECYGFKIKVIF